MDDLRMSRRMLKSSGSSQFRTRSRDLPGESFGHVSWTAHDPFTAATAGPSPRWPPASTGRRFAAPSWSAALGADTFVASGTTNGRNRSTVNGMTMASSRLIYATTTGTLSTVDFPAGLPTGSATVVSGAAVDGRSWQSRA
jgi:hypothetical protein